MEKEKPADDVYQMLSESGYADRAIQYLQNKAKICIIEDADQVTGLTGPWGDTM